MQLGGRHTRSSSATSCCLSATASRLSPSSGAADMMCPFCLSPHVMKLIRVYAASTWALTITSRSHLSLRSYLRAYGHCSVELQPHAPSIYRVADLVVDPRTRRVERAGYRIDLTPKEFALLQFLLEHAGEVVSRTLIAECVWDMHFDSGTNVIDVQVKRLRSKIDTNDLRPLIHTVRGVGYMMEDREAGCEKGREDGESAC